jgi:hypothetical protein
MKGVTAAVLLLGAFSILNGLREGSTTIEPFKTMDEKLMEAFLIILGSLIAVAVVAIIIWDLFRGPKDSAILLAIAAISALM